MQSPKHHKHLDPVTTDQSASLLRNNQMQAGPVGVSSDFIDDSELQKRLGLCRKTLFNLRQSGQLPYCRVGGRIKYHWKSVETKILLRQCNGGGL